MSQVPSFKSATNPELEAARARERLRALSGKARGAGLSGGFPVMILAAILLACLLMYLNIGRGQPTVLVGKPACPTAVEGHPCK